MSRWIVFDAVGTLITPAPGVAEAYAEAGRRHGTRLSADEIGGRFRTAYAESDRTCFPPDRRGRTSEAEEIARWRWIVAQVLPDVADREACFRELWEHFARPDSWRVCPDAAETLPRLVERGCRLALASNFDSRLHALCAGEPALSGIALRCISTELGWRKPAPEFYAALAAACAAAPSELLMIGDDWECDVAAARRAGLQALQIDRRAAVPTADVLTSLTQLPARVRLLSAR